MSGGRSEVLIGVGSNIDPFINIEKAIYRLNQYSPIKRVSSFYLSEPYGFVDQEDFVNGCILMESLASPEELKFSLKKIEERIGRIRKPDKNSPRTIDLDILLFGSLIVDGGGVTIPDPEMFERNYLLCPAREIAGHMANPLTGIRVSDYPFDRVGLTPLSFMPSF